MLVEIHCTKCKFIYRVTVESDKDLYCRNCKSGLVRYVEIKEKDDAVNHPKHYTSHPSGIECIQITEYMNFNLGNAVKYIWRASEKEDAITDLKKAAWYVNREIERLERDGQKESVIKIQTPTS